MGLLVLLVLAAGCEHGSEPASATLRLNLASERFQNSRSLLPSSEDLSIASVRITGTGPKGQTIDVQSNKQLVEIGNLAIGTWNLHAVGYNSNEVALVSGDLTTLLSSVTNEATLQLTQLVGEGTLSVQLSWDREQVASDVRLEAQLIDQEGEPVALSVGALNTEAGNVTLQKNLPAGSYYLKLQLFSQGVQVSGASHAVRILDGTTSDGAIEFIIGDLSTTYTIMVINNTMLPIEGGITASPAQAKAGEEVTLTYAANNLPDGVAMDSLHIQWYCEGVLVHQAEADFTSTPLAGVHRYDVIVNHERLGSLGSSTILLDMPK